MKHLTKLQQMIEQRAVVHANWINFPSANEIRACRQALLDAGYVLDTRSVAYGCECLFMNPGTWLPQEHWTPCRG